MDQNACLNSVKKDKLYRLCKCTHEQKMKFEGFTQNGCYGNQSQPFELVFYSIDTDTSCSFTKQGLTVKQAYHVFFSVQMNPSFGS